MGTATAALAALVGWAARLLDVPTIRLVTDEENIALRRVAVKAGFVEVPHRPTERLPGREAKVVYEVSLPNDIARRPSRRPPTRPEV